MDIIKELETEQVGKLTADRPVPEFGPGDTLRVNVKVVEGTRERIQAFEGVCIGRKNAGLNSAFTVRKISYGEGVERVFPLFSPTIASIEVIRRGDVRRAKLYYLRGRTGKRARIAEKTDWVTGAAAGAAEAAAAQEAEAAAQAAEAAPEPPPKRKKRKKKHDVEVPETGEAPPEILAEDVAPPPEPEPEADAADAAADAAAEEKAEAPAKEKPAKKAKKPKKAEASPEPGKAQEKAPKKKAAKKAKKEKNED